jgi:threonine/homoserine/homoserine lactone efflux protein
MTPAAPAEAAGMRPARGTARSLLLALATQLSNPKTVVVIGGIFAALLPAHVPGWMYIAIPPVDFLIEGSWYTFVAVAMSSAAPRALYLGARSWIDRAAGCVLGVLGLRLILEGAREAG